MSRNSYETRTMEDCLDMARSMVSKEGKQSQSGLAEEDYIESLASLIAYQTGVLILPELEFYERYERRKDRDEVYIEAAFRSFRTNEVFMFTGFHYFVVKYDAQSHSQKEKEKENRVIKAPLLLVDGFYELYDIPSFRHKGVDAAFGCHYTNEAFLFAGAWIAKIRYGDNNEGEVLKLESVRREHMFPCLKGTKFFDGYFDAACESTMPDEAYLFRGSDFALINYSKLTLIRTGSITDEFSCLRNTVFESEIGSAFALHAFNQLYFFKDKTCVLIEFDSKTKQSCIIAGPEEIAPTNWPCLEGLVPYKKGKTPNKPKTWKPVWVDGYLERAPLDTVSTGKPPAPPLADCSLERTRSTGKRKVEDYSLDATMIPGSSSKKRAMEDKCYMQRRPRYRSHYIDAAFRSTRVNEVFMFTGREYFVVKYDVDSRKWKDVIKGPLLLTDALKELCDTRFEIDGVDAAFGCHGTGTAFLFSGRCIAKIKYDLNIESLVELKDEAEGIQWFCTISGLEEDTKFCQGCLDAACESSVPDEAYLFRGSKYALINYSDLILIREGCITEEFTCLQNTLFESEIGSAFASHTSNQFYFFKDNTYVIIEFDPETKGSCIIAGPEKIEPTNWPCLEGLVPYKKDIGPDSDSEMFSSEVSETKESYILAGSGKIDHTKWRPSLCLNCEKFVPGPNEPSLAYPGPFEESILEDLCGPFYST